ncbi:hypothetical protein DJ90_6217 [Paenibacillus macerans]|uniref:Uncharacterized protein n=1 Tax=Paenibacillus macerans TaxID=44252 RepID=A0A090XS59_PAEMA|nr:hypothetical protein DJ90_6217 [Paenibacillus macerans]
MCSTIINYARRAQNRNVTTAGSFNSGWSNNCCYRRRYTGNQCCCSKHVNNFLVKLCHNLFFSSLNFINYSIIFFVSSRVTHQSLHLLSEYGCNSYKMISVTISQKLETKIM